MSNNIKRAVNDMRMNDSEMTIKEVTKPGQFRRYPSKDSLGRETKEEMKSDKRDEFLVF
jgi:hypothetical protein